MASRISGTALTRGVVAVRVESVDAVERFRGVVSAAVGRLTDLDAVARTALLRVSIQASDNVAVAQARMEACREQLNSARAELASCESRREKDETLDCGAEASVVAAAEVALVEAERRLEEAMRFAERIAGAGGALEAQQAQLENWIASAFPYLDSAIYRAVEQLRGYLATGAGEAPGTATPLSSLWGSAPAAAWTSWRPAQGGGAIMPPEVLNRFRVNERELRDITRHMALNDKVFQQEILRRRRDYASAQGPAERDAVYLQTTKNSAGLWGNRFSALALAPFAQEVACERYVADMEADGRGGTVTDLVLKKLHSGFVIGRGTGAGAPRGGSISVEIKTGQKDYIYAQLQHMRKQVGGHGGESASLCLVSRDFKDLPRDKQRAFRGSLHAAGSRVFAVLPRKEVIDQLCWEQVCCAGGES